ncbi:hypothetical protein [Flavobacterium phycosphaerae]|uniref:hypothetical protein n=1 Tax=Flavobacterium phycosphaerae TaxID=2697515 RepID=UPI00138964BE|nr:hypothetical protein [Flavobacterium phycosphaerae]
MSEQINQFIKEVEEAKVLIENELSINLKFLDIQLALAEKLGYEPEDSTRTASHNLTAVQIFEMLIDFNFPRETETVILESSILPEDAIRRIDEQRIKSKGEIWVIYKYDKDPLPSNPHAHNEATGQKLDLSNGNLYDSKNNYLGTNISKKNLELLRGKVINISLPKLKI